MTATEVGLAIKAVLVLEGGTCRMLNGADKDPKVAFVPLPEGGYKALSEVLWQGDDDGLSPESKLLIQSIDALLDVAYKSGIAEGRTLAKDKGRKRAGRHLGVKMYGGSLHV